MVNHNDENGLDTKVKVLVADDEHVIANTLATILNQSGFDARAVYSGSAAVEAVSSFHPDILLSDVIMPGVSGIEAAIEILKRCPACRVLLFSAQASAADLLFEARANGHSFEILSKPVHPLDLLQRLRAADVRTMAAI